MCHNPFVSRHLRAGRGPLAGPVVAAAVILPEKFRHKVLNEADEELQETQHAI